MVTPKKKQLADLLRELRNERLSELREKGLPVEDIRYIYELYEMDKDDDLLETIDNLLALIGEDYWDDLR